MIRTVSGKPYRGMTPDPKEATTAALQAARSGNLPLVEIFYSLQGEGLRTGQATTFVRFAGCNLACDFCDTDFRIREQSSLEMVIQTVRSQTTHCRWVCLTGGEPTIHDLKPLCDVLHDHGYSIQMETNGTRPQPSWEVDHVTVSPKESQGGKLHAWYLTHATEFKHVIDDQNDIDLVLATSALHTNPVYLQPNSLNPSAEEICVKSVLRYPQRFRLSLQTHKLLSIR